MERQRKKTKTDRDTGAYLVTVKRERKRQTDKQAERKKGEDDIEQTKDLHLDGGPGLSLLWSRHKEKQIRMLRREELELELGLRFDPGRRGSVRDGSI